MIDTEDFFSEHISQRYNKELTSLFDDSIKMGSLVEEQLNDALTAFFSKNTPLAMDVVHGDQSVNLADLKLHEQCVATLARRQPTASDLRLIITILSFSKELERIGDLAKKIAKYASVLEEGDHPSIDDLSNLANITKQNLNHALTAFVRLDKDAALHSIEQDAEINKEKDKLSHHILQTIQKNPETTMRAIQINIIVSTLERIGDHAKNIGESVFYLVSGDDIRYQDLDAVREQYITT